MRYEEENKNRMEGILEARYAKLPRVFAERSYGVG